MKTSPSRIKVGAGATRLALFVVLLALGPAAHGASLEWLRADPIAETEAARLAITAAGSHLEGKSAPDIRTTAKSLAQSGGAFVTFLRGTKVRACWGTMWPQTPDLAHEIAHSARRALYADHRRSPISRAEWPHLAILVSIVGPLERVMPGAMLFPLHQGLFVTQGAKGGVLLPGEARTARFQMAECRRKAGIRPRERADLFRFDTWRVSTPTRLARAN